MTKPNNTPPEVKGVSGLTAVQAEIEDAAPVAKPAGKAPAKTAQVDDEVLDAAVKAAEEAAAEETAEAETEETTETEPETEAAAKEEGEAEAEKPAEKKAEEKPEEALVEDFDEALEAPPAEKPAEKPADVVKLEADLAQAKQAAGFGSFVDQALQKDPELELAFLKHLKKNGLNMTPVNHARLAELEAQMRPQTPGVFALNWEGKTVNVTQEQIEAQHAKWLKEGKTLSAARLLTEFQRVQDEIAQGPARAAALAKQKAEEEAKALAAADEKIQASIQSQLKALAPKLGAKYLVTHKNGFTEIVDKQFAAALAENARGVAPDAPLAKLVRYTLFTMGRLKAPAAKGAPKPIGKPPLQSSRSKSQRGTPQPKGKLPQGQTFVPVELANE